MGDRQVCAPSHRVVRVARSPAPPGEALSFSSSSSSPRRRRSLPCRMAAIDLAAVIREMEAICGEPSFVAEVRDFVEAHCELFEEGEENKLEYTEIHLEYERRVEARVEAELQARMPGVDMRQVLEALPEYISSGQDEGEGTAGALDMLMSFGDFVTFKDMMLVAKRDRAAPREEGGVQQVAMPEDLKEKFAEVAALEVAGAGADEAAWTSVLAKPWISMDRYARAGCPDLIRTSMDLDMTVEQAEDMMISLRPETPKWMGDMLTECEVVREESGPDDRVIRMGFKMPMMKTQIWVVRVIVVRDFPDPGCVTYVYVPVPGETPEGGMSSMGNGLIRPLLSGCRMTIIDEIPRNWVPNFLMNWMISSFTPRIMSSMASKYKKVTGLA